jgi:hypothetical protein
VREREQGSSGYDWARAHEEDDEHERGAGLMRLRQGGSGDGSFQLGCARGEMELDRGAGTGAEEMVICCLGNWVVEVMDGDFVMRGRGCW